MAAPGCGALCPVTATVCSEISRGRAKRRWGAAVAACAEGIETEDIDRTGSDREVGHFVGEPAYDGGLAWRVHRRMTTRARLRERVVRCAGAGLSRNPCSRRQTRTGKVSRPMAEGAGGGRRESKRSIRQEASGREG